eukprot:14736933-Alexandrium_andersonii.AAC.1
MPWAEGPCRCLGFWFLRCWLIAIPGLRLSHGAGNPQVVGCCYVRPTCKCSWHAMARGKPM